MFWNKIVATYVLAIGLGIAGVCAIAFKAESPRQLIIGRWNELEWLYEKAEKSTTEKSAYKEVKDEVKELTGQDLVIHKFETWEFLPDGRLRLYFQGKETFVQWNLKGRGHILELNSSGNKEYYNIMSLTDSSLVINYDTDLEVRGIGKLTFKRNRKNI